MKSITYLTTIALLLGAKTVAACQPGGYIVIGAGISGLAAANYLKSQNCQVTVLEGRNRVGGRISTETMGTTGGGIKVDMGAQWIHGIGPGVGELPEFRNQENPIYTLANQNNISSIPTWQTETLAIDSTYWWKGLSTPLNQAKVTNMSDAIWSYIKQRQVTANQTMTIEDSLAGFVYGNTSDDLLIYKATVNHLFSQDYAAEPSELSAKFFDADEQFNGAEHIFPDGYSQVTKALAANLNIVLNKPVTSIDSTGSLVFVTTDDGTKYNASRVIITVPLSVLQSGMINFTPSLPQDKMDAINRLGMGVMDKLWLEFPTAFWANDTNSDWINYISDTPGQWVQTLNVYKYTQKPVLVMFNVGQAAKSFMAQSDSQVLASAMSAIKKWYPNAPNYIIYKRSNWGIDPFALGSYPFLKAGATPQDCVKYQDFASTGNKLFFAGDGVSCTFIGTAHGAYLTGVEAAKRSITPGSTAATLMASIFSVFALVLMFAY